MSNHYRYPGAKPFESMDSTTFFGRDRDIKDLERLISEQKLTVLFSKSGMGKSSLLNAGLVPRMEAVGKTACKIRFGGFWGAGNGTLTENLTMQFHSLAKPPTETFLEKVNLDESTTRSLWYIIKNWEIQHPKGNLFLIFDQFEELFTYPPEQIEQFCIQLSEVVFGATPTTVQNLIMDAEAKGIQTLTNPEINELLEPVQVHCLFAIRSDRLSFFNRLTNYLPNILRKSYELTGLTPEQAHVALTRPANSPGDFTVLPFEFSEGAILAILDHLSSNDNRQIEPFQLQTIGSFIENKQMVNWKSIIKPEDLGDINTLYENYYENILAGLHSEGLQQARKLIEEGLIFEPEQRRLSVYEGQIIQTYGISKSLLDELVSTRLLRVEPSSSGGFMYEISHDTLVRPILRAKSKRNREELFVEENTERVELEIERKQFHEQNLKREHIFQKQRRQHALSRLLNIVLVCVILYLVFKK